MEIMEETTNETQFLTFFISGDEFGVSIIEVKEIIEYTLITKVPAMPASVLGVINLRGSVVPVVDLVTRFGLPTKNPVTHRTCIIIVEVDHEGKKNLVGVIADHVNQVIDLLPEEIEPPPSFGAQIQAGFLKGLGKRDKKFILILNMDNILSPDELRSGMPELPAKELKK